MTDTRDKLPSRPSSIGQAHRIIVQLKARVDYLNTINHNQCGTITRLQARVDGLDKQRHEAWEKAGFQIADLKAQLHEEMQDCTIVFEKCEKGHGHLRGTNWIKVGCQQCRLDAIESDRDRLEVIATKWCPRDHHDWQELTDIYQKHLKRV